MLRNNGRHNFRSPFGIQPSLVLDFAGTGTLDSRVTFTRSTTGTYYNSSGVLSTAAMNAPRFDYNPSTLEPLGLLIEQSSTNLVLYSEQFDNLNWTALRATVTPNNTVSPDGTSNADLILDTAVSGTHVLIQTVTKSATAIPYTASVYLKASTRNNGELRMSDQSGNGIRVVFNLSAGTVGSPIVFGTGYTIGTSSITPVGNNWYRVSASGTSNTATVNSLEIYIANASLATSYVGNGSGFFVFGADLEALAFPTSYIKTDTLQVTRASDNASMTGTNFSNWYNQGQGTFYCSANCSPTTLIYSGFFNLQSSSSPSSPLNAYNNGSNNVTWIPSGNQTFGANQNFAGNYTTSTSALSASGASPLISNTIGVGSVNYTSLIIGASTYVRYLNGYIKKLAYYPIALTSAQLQALTGS
jgi:hypothetical protein